MNLNTEFIKSCFIPQCENESKITPNKLFIAVPKDVTEREKWFTMCNMSQELMLADIYCCEDHFELSDALKNYKEIQAMRGSSTLCELKPELKSDIYPTKFQCQQKNVQMQDQHCSLQSGRINQIQHIQMNLANFVETELTEYDDDEYSVNKIVDVEVKMEDQTSSNVELPEQVYVMESESLDIKEEQEQDPIDSPENNNRINSSAHCQNFSSNQFTLNINPAEQSTKSQSSEESYISVKLIEEPYECKICQKRYKHSGSLRKHYKIHSGDKNFECSICYKKFFYSCHLNSHRKVHSIEKPLECTICQKRFKHYGSLQIHMRSHSKDKPFECSICKKKFSQSSNLYVHSRIHSGYKPHECSFCQKKFNQFSSYQRHLRIHTGEKPCVCSICEKRFRCSELLQSHMYTHSDVRSFECSICEKKFKRSSSLYTHMKIHSDDKRFECTICQKYFCDLSQLQTHIKSHSEKPFECSICEIKLDNSNSLQKHLQIHSREP